jgi:L-2,4-diaminobutyrate decarboxylase
MDEVSSPNAPNTPNTPLDAAFDGETFRSLGHALVDQLADHLHRVRDREQPVLTWEDPEPTAAYWKQRLQQSRTQPEDLEALISEVLKTAFRGHHARNLGHQVGPALPLAAATDLVASLLDTGSGIYELSNPATAMERVVIQRLAQKIGYPENADGVLTSGGSLGNLTALLAMRERQASTTKHPVVLVSEEVHYSIDRALRIMGFGEESAVSVPVDATFQLRASALHNAFTQARDRGAEVMGVVACAGSTGTGRIDALEEIADFCHSHQLWLHVDAAHAGAFLFSESKRSELAGLERADSVVIDFHKMMLSSSLLTAVIYRQARDSYLPFAQKADYLWSTDEPGEWWDGAKRTLECTRPMLGLRAYPILACAGEGLLEAYIDHALEATQTFADLIEAADDFELLVRPQSNILCYRYRPPGLPEAGTDALNRALRAPLVREGRFYIVQIEKRGRLYLRSAVMNPFAHRTVFEELLEAIRAAAALLRP